MVTLERRWVRSWPAIVPLDRNHVVDDLPRLKVSDYDLASNPDSWTVLRDCTLLEWDIVLSVEDMKLWEAHVGQDPELVHVASYKVYAGCGYTENGRMPAGPNQFGFGMIWFPAQILDWFHEDSHHPHAQWFTDGTFSAWYTDRLPGGPLVHHDVRPVHLHYRVSLPAAAHK